MGELNRRVQEEERNFRFEVQGRWESERWEIRIRVVFRTVFLTTGEKWVQDGETRRSMTVMLPNRKEPLELSFGLARGLMQALEEALR